MKGMFKWVTVPTIFAIFIFLFISQSKDRAGVEPAENGGNIKINSNYPPISSLAKNQSKPRESSSSVVTLGENRSEVSTAVSSSSLRPSTSSSVPVAEDKIFSKREPKIYSGHEMAEFSQQIRPRRQMYKNPRLEAFGGFTIPVEQVDGCVRGDDEVDEPKYLYTCAFLLMDRYFTDKALTSNEKDFIWKKAHHLYIRAASLGHVGAMDALSMQIASRFIGKENFYSYEERFSQVKIESMAWFFVGEFVGASNLSSYHNMKILLPQAHEGAIRAAEELALFYIDFYGIPWE